MGLVLVCAACGGAVTQNGTAFRCNHCGPLTEVGSVKSGGRRPQLIAPGHPRYDEVFGGGGIPTIADDLTEAEFNDWRDGIRQ